MQKSCFRIMHRLKSSFSKSTVPQRKYDIDPTIADNLPIFDYYSKYSAHSRVYAWGRSETGALGVKLNKHNDQFIKQPKRLAFAHMHEVTDITCGYGFTAFAVKSRDLNKVYGCGINTDSQIGYHLSKSKKHFDYILIPQPISLPLDSSDSKVISMSAGRAHLLILTDEGLFTLGNNSYGQCGRNIVEDEIYSGSSIIYKVPEFTTESLRDVQCGQDHSLVITDSGQVYSCGWGADGQTGLGHYKNAAQFSEVFGDISKENIVKVASSSDCVLALSDKGEVFGWGNTEYGQLLTKDHKQQVHTPIHLNIGNICGRVIDIAAGGSFCMVLNDRREVFVWGYGLLGLGPKVQHSLEPLKIPGNLFGTNSFNPDCKVVSVHSGLSCMAAINSIGDLYTWGRNSGGNLGLGHNNDQYFPLKVSVGAFVNKVSCSVDHSVTLCKPFT